MYSIPYTREHNLWKGAAGAYVVDMGSGIQRWIEVSKAFVILVLDADAATF